MNFKVGQFLQYVHLEPIRTGVIESLNLTQNVNLLRLWRGKEISGFFNINNNISETKNKM